ncbi:MAG: hypothetical protein E7343_01930 [Clostridiales bacterium]|nr:hypothetical protein [Clostridiales bacterium]
MSEQEKKNLNQETANSTAEEMALMIEGLYNGIVASLKKLKGEICNEMKYSALQINAYCETIQQEATQMVAKNHAMILAVSKELKYGYQQNQMIHEDLVHLISDDLFAKIEEWSGKVDAVSEKLEAVSEIEKVIPAIEEASKALTEKIEALKDNDELLEKIKEIVAGTYETVDYAKINDMIDSSVIKAENSIIEQTQEIVENATVASAEQSQQILNAINAIEIPEAVDYTRIVEEVSERVLELLREEFTVYQEEVIDEELEEEILEDEVEEESEETEELVEEVSEEVVTEETTEEVASETEEVVEEPVEETVEETVVTDEVVETVEEPEEEVVVEKPVITEIDYDRIVERTAEKVVESLPFVEKIDYKQIEEMIQAVVLDVVVLADEVADKVVEKLPQPEAPEAIDYERIAEVVAETVPAPEMIDYERLSETVVSKIPAPEAVDYDRLAETVLAKIPAPETVDYDRLAETVLAKMPVPETVDYDRLAETVLAKMPTPETIDYEALSDIIVSKMPKPVEPAPVDYETLAEMVAAKMVAPTYDVVLDAEGIENVALGVCENLNVTALAEMVVEKLNYEQLADMVAERLAVKIEFVSEPIVEVEEPIEEVVEEAQEETVVEETTEVVEEVVAEEPAEVVEEVVTEETVEEPVDEIAVAQDSQYMEEGNELVDAETGMVVRLKRSFTAKLKQSDEEVKVFYDMIKNELASYKKVKSTVSWHGDRFNLGRATVAKMNICGKTLCFYVALNPEDPELKTTVYHQKNVGDQKAYQATPFKVKVKSEMGAKRAIRLVGVLAEKIGAVKKPDYVATDYVQEFAYETTKELLDKGLIKETKEKKIAFEF